MNSQAPSLAGLTLDGVVRQSRTSDGSTSVDEQIARLKREAKQHSFKLRKIHVEEDVSGQRPLLQRPGLRQAVEAVEGGLSQGIVVGYFDRLCRSTKVQNEVVDRVEAQRGLVLTVDFGQISNGSAIQWLSGNLLGMVNEYVARQAGERLAWSKAENIAKGVPPFARVTPAYRKVKNRDGDGVDGRLAPTAQAPVVAEAVRMRGEGASLVAVQRFLLAAGLSYKSPATVQKLLSSRLLRGEIHFGSFAPNLAAHDAIVTEEEWQRANTAQAPRGRHGQSERLLARQGLLRCGTCGARMIVNTSGRRQSRKTGLPLREYAYYVCGNQVCEHRAIISAVAAEEAVRDEALRLLAGMKGRAAASARLEAARLGEEQAEAALKQAIRNLAAVAAEAEAQAVLAELREKRDAAVELHARLRAVTAPDRTVTSRAGWERGTLEERRALLRNVIASATVAAGRGPGRLSIEGREEVVGQ